MAKQRGERAYEKMDENHSFVNKGLVNKNTYGDTKKMSKAEFEYVTGKDKIEARSKSLERFNANPANQQLLQNYRAMSPYTSETQPDFKGNIKVSDQQGGYRIVPYAQQQAAQQAYEAAKQNWFSNDAILQRRLVEIEKGTNKEFSNI